MHHSITSQSTYKHYSPVVAIHLATQHESDEDDENNQSYAMYSYIEQEQQKEDEKSHKQNINNQKPITNQLTSQQIKKPKPNTNKSNRHIKTDFDQNVSSQKLTKSKSAKNVKIIDTSKKDEVTGSNKKKYERVVTPRNLPKVVTNKQKSTEQKSKSMKSLISNGKTINNDGCQNNSQKNLARTNANKKNQPVIKTHNKQNTFHENIIKKQKNDKNMEHKHYVPMPSKNRNRKLGINHNAVSMIVNTSHSININETEQCKNEIGRESLLDYLLYGNPTSPSAKPIQNKYTNFSLSKELESEQMLLDGYDDELVDLMKESPIRFFEEQSQQKCTKTIPIVNSSHKFTKAHHPLFYESTVVTQIFGIFSLKKDKSPHANSNDYLICISQQNDRQLNFDSTLLNRIRSHFRDCPESFMILFLDLIVPHNNNQADVSQLLFPRVRSFLLHHDIIFNKKQLIALIQCIVDKASEEGLDFSKSQDVGRLMEIIILKPIKDNTQIPICIMSIDPFIRENQSISLWELLAMYNNEIYKKNRVMKKQKYKENQESEHTGRDRLVESDYHNLVKTIASTIGRFF